MEHVLKTHPPYFAAVRNGIKPFEVRFDDRGYQVNDMVVLAEYDPVTATYTGETVGPFTITYILRDFVGLTPGYVGLGLGRER